MKQTPNQLYKTVSDADLQPGALLKLRVPLRWYFIEMKLIDEIWVAQPGEGIFATPDLILVLERPSNRPEHAIVLIDERIGFCSTSWLIVETELVSRSPIGDIISRPTDTRRVFGV